MERDETLTYRADADPENQKDGRRRPAPLQVRDPDRYQIIAEHGRGGIGRVLRATDREFGRDIALKELLIRTTTSELRFMREAIITARLEHPNIVPVHEAGTWPDGTPFYAMKLVSGRPLKALIDDARTSADRLALVERVLAVVDAIAYAHARGVIHRDLKPSNVIVGEYGETIVIDWGLAKELGDLADASASSDGEAPRSPELTTGGTVMGTPAYMAPEQAVGGVVDERSDVYALGAILRDVMAGPAPHAESTASAADSTSAQAAIAARDRPRQRPTSSSIPSDLRSIIDRAMATSPIDRYRGARELGADLRRFLAGERVAAHRYTARERASRWLATHRRLVRSGVAVLVAVAAASVWFLARESSLRAAAETERDRADQQTLVLLEQQGRTELENGSPFRAAAFLAEAYRRAPDSVPVRWLMTEALRALDSLTLTFNVRAAPVAGQRRPDTTFSVAMRADDQEVLTGHSRSVALWDASTGALRRRYQVPWRFNQATYSDDSSRLLLQVERAGDAPARMLRADDGVEVAAVPVGAETTWLAWSFDGRRVAAVDDSGHVNVWTSTPAPAVERSFQTAPHAGWGNLAFSPDGALLAARGAGELILTSLASRTERRLPIPGEEVRTLTFSPDSRLLLATVLDGTVRMWDVASGRLIGKLPPHRGMPTTAMFNRDASMIATVDDNGLHLWDVTSTIRLASFALQTGDETYGAAFAHGRSRIVTASAVGDVRIWDVPQERWARPLAGHRGLVRGAYAGPARAVTLDNGDDGRGTLRIWNTVDGTARATALSWDAACGLAVSPDGRRVAVSTDGRPTIVDIESGAVDRRLDGVSGKPAGLAFSPDGRQLAVTTDDGTVQIWSLEDGRSSGPLFRDPEGSLLSAVAFHPDGQHVLASGVFSRPRVLEIATGRVVYELTEGSNHAAYSADGRRFITSNLGGESPPKVWDSATGQLVAALEMTTTGAAMAVALGPDGRIAATVDPFGVVRISDASTGALLRQLAGPTQIATSGGHSTLHTLAFSPDGHHLLATDRDYALLWNLELDRRTPDEVARVVAARSPWRLVDGRLVRAP